MTNKELMRKAAITTDSMAAAGLLNAEQSNKFLDYVIDETTMKNMVRTVKFKPSQKLIEKIQVANRVAVPKAEAKDPGVRRGVSTSKVTLEHHEIMVPFEIGDTLKEENIEGDSVENHIIKMMATQLANNIEELFWDGNTAGPAVVESELLEGGSTSQYVKDSYLTMFNGWLKAAEAGNVIDAANASINKSLFSKAINAMPNKFKRDKRLLKFLTSTDHEQDYREGLSSRVDSAGTNALSAQGNLPAFGIEIFPVSLMNASPIYAEDSIANNDGTSTTALSFGPISDLVLVPTTISDSPVTPYILNTDYTVDETNGTWIRLGAGAITSAQTVRATYRTAGRVILCNPKNMILALGREIRLERQRNIYKTVNEFAMTVKIYCTFEETDAVVLVKNIALPG